MLVCKIEKQDIPVIVDIHINAFEDFFLTSLGRGFLKTYYALGVKPEESISFCAKSTDGEIVGFCFGTQHSRGFHKRLIKRNLLRFTFLGVKVILSKPNAIARLLSNLEKRSEIKDSGDYAELLSIAIRKNTTGSGVGGMLLDCFEREAAKRGCKQVALTTDYYENENVIRFYKKNGYSNYSEFFAYPNRKMYKLMKAIP